MDRGAAQPESCSVALANRGLKAALLHLAACHTCIYVHPCAGLGGLPWRTEALDEALLHLDSWSGWFGRTNGRDVIRTLIAEASPSELNHMVRLCRDVVAKRLSMSCSLRQNQDAMQGWSGHNRHGSWHTLCCEGYSLYLRRQAAWHTFAAMYAPFQHTSAACTGPAALAGVVATVACLCPADCQQQHGALLAPMQCGCEGGAAA